MHLHADTRARVHAQVRGPADHTVLRRTMRHMLLAGMAGLTLAFAGCAAPEPAPAPDAGPDNRSQECKDSILTWENFGQSFVRNWCAGCHSAEIAPGDRYNAPVGIDLDTLAEVRKHAVRNIARATGENPTMPPGGGPGAHEREQFATWLECGAPTEAGD